jgi:hypothetical protein
MILEAIRCGVDNTKNPTRVHGVDGRAARPAWAVLTFINEVRMRRLERSASF